MSLAGAYLFIRTWQVYHVYKPNDKLQTWTPAQVTYLKHEILFFFLLWRFDPIPGHGLPLRGLRDHTGHTTLGSIPMDERSARQTDLYLATYNTYKRQASVPAAGFEPTIPASERKQIKALDCAATRIGLGTNRLSSSTGFWRW